MARRRYSFVPQASDPARRTTCSALPLSRGVLGDWNSSTIGLAALAVTFSPILDADSFPAAVGVSRLDGSNGVSLEGVAPDDFSSISISDAGDVNGDGIDDIVIGAYKANRGRVVNTGAAYIVFGSTDIGGDGKLPLADLDGINGFVVEGLENNDRLGLSVSGAGDFNDDGIDDLILSGQVGESYVIFGTASLGAGGSFDLSSLSGNNGFVVSDSGTVTDVGDVNDDGVVDLMVGNSVIFGGNDIGSEGLVSVSDLAESDGFLFEGASLLDSSDAGDVNADGVTDIIVGALTGAGRPGRAYVVYGSKDLGDGGSLRLAELDGSDGFRLDGEISVGTSRGAFGTAVSAAGDVDGDGVDDVVIGAPNINTSYVVFGAQNLGSSGSIAVSALDGGGGFALDSGRDNSSGISVADAGDIDGDGFDDIVIGADYSINSYIYSTAVSHVVFGRSDIGENSPVILSNMDGSDGFAIGPVVFGELGGSVSRAGDFNADGIDDVMVGEVDGRPGGRRNAGITHVLFGSQRPAPDKLCNDLVVTVDLAEGDMATNADDVILGTPETDLIDSGAGDDTICAGSGDDIIDAGGGSDWIDGGEGDDAIRSSGGDDVVFGGDGDDDLDGGAGNDELYGGLGDDTLIGRLGDDLLDGDQGVDAISGGPGSDTIFTGAGGTLGQGLFVSGGGGADTIFGGPDADDIRAGGGADDVSAGGGNDVVSGGIGRDTLRGAAGDDVLRGQGSRDTLIGGAGDDELLGGAGNDVLDGGGGDDGCNGQAGDDEAVSLRDSLRSTLTATGPARSVKTPFLK